MSNWHLGSSPQIFRGMTTNSSDTEVTYTSRVSKENAQCIFGVSDANSPVRTCGESHKSTSRDLRAVLGNNCRARKKWRARNDWRSSFVQEVQETIRQRKRRSLHCAVTSSLLAKSRMRKTLREHTSNQRKCSPGNLVDLESDGTDNLFCFDMLQDATIDSITSDHSTATEIRDTQDLGDSNVN